MVMMPLSLVRLMEEYAQVEIDDGCFQIMAQNALLIPCECDECVCHNDAEDNYYLCGDCQQLCTCPECHTFHSKCEC